MGAPDKSGGYEYFFMLGDLSLLQLEVAVENTHRQYRRDLVPLRQTVEPYGWRPPLSSDPPR